MINSFSSYLIEEKRTAYFTFSKMNPPTASHGELLSVMTEAAGKNTYRVFLSQAHDNKKNPLTYSEKVKHSRRMFSKHGRSIVVNKDVRNVLEAMTALHKDGFKNVVMCVGENRVREMSIVLEKHNGQDGSHGLYNFKSIKVMSSGADDPDGLTADTRIAVQEGNYAEFTRSLPKTIGNHDSRRLFNDIRKGFGLDESKDFKRHVQLESVSDKREAFVAGKLYELGESVIIKKTDVVGKITVLGSNYVIVETASGSTRQWLDSVEKIQEYAPAPGAAKRLPDWGTPESTKRAKKFTPGEGVDEKSKGLWHNIHQRRKKGLPPKKPGEKGYPKTLNIKDDVDHMKMAKDKISKEKEVDGQKHDKILDRARMARARHLNNKKSSTNTKAGGNEKV